VIELLAKAIVHLRLVRRGAGTYNRRTMGIRFARPHSWLPAIAWVVVASRLIAGDGTSRVSDPASHWSFRKPVRSAVPQVSHGDRVRTPVDAFVLARLEANRLALSVDADRAGLVRRSYFDLLGFPPSPEDIDEFLADTGPDAYERLLDRLLDSPRFGERWARHWLDVVGYTDTVGFDIDAALIIQSDGKWRYRDYVIRSFNDDKPYDRFVREQLAGDESVDWRNAEKYTPQILEKLVATGYLRTAQDYSHEPESNIPLNHFAVLHDTLEIVGSSLLGLTLNCARCHDHKFDPIPQQDYYRMMALFTPAYNPKDWRAVTPYKAGIQDRALPDVSAPDRAAIEQHNADIDAKAAKINEQLKALRRPYEERLFADKLSRVPEPIREDTRNAIEMPADKRNEVQKYLASKFEASLKVSVDEITKALEAADKQTNDELQQQIGGLTALRRGFGKIQALFDLGQPPVTHLLVRGNHETPGSEVHPGFLSLLRDSDPPESPSDASASVTSGRRTAFAEWLTRSDSNAAGLMARVLVNRIWQHLFGEGLTATPDNFGLGGEPPTHPELLDWLSVEFMQNGWQIKPLIKLIMSSTVYRQSSRRMAYIESPKQVVGDGARSDAGGVPPEVDPEAIDPDNRLLWRQRLRRLESEVIRDSILAASGELDQQMEGPPVLLESRPDGMVIVSDKAATGKWRRSVYLLSRHQYHLSMLTVFDQPVLATNCTRRTASAVPLQSLTMMNDATLAELAEQFAARVADAAGPSQDRQIDAAFRLALGRPPSSAEVEWCQHLLRRQTELYETGETSNADAGRLALAHLCQTLLNTSEFLYAQ
jgi:hypothetical protein